MGFSLTVNINCHMEQNTADYYINTDFNMFHHVIAASVVMLFCSVYSFKKFNVVSYKLRSYHKHMVYK